MGLNVLSLFDGMSCGRIALERAGINVDKYYSSEIDKHAIKVADKNYPMNRKLGDVTKWAEWDLPEINLLIGGSPCFVAGTSVASSPIAKPIENIQVGDMVLSHDGTYNEVTDVGGYENDTFEITAQGVYTIETTEEHPFLISVKSKTHDNKSRKYMSSFSVPEWRPLKDIKVGEYVCVPTIQGESNPYNLSEEECNIIGRYIADGHTSKHYRSSEGRPNDRQWQLILSVGSHKIPVYKQHHGVYKHTESTHRVTFSCKRLVEIVEQHCGCGAKNKFISAMLLGLPKTHLRALLNGIEEGDGSVRNNTYRISSISKQLIMDIARAVQKVYNTGASVDIANRPPTCVIQGRTVNQSVAYSIGYKHEYPVGANYYRIDGYILYRVKSVKPTGEKKIVYNMTVSNTNTYTANNCAVHNCTGFSSAGKGLAFDDPRSKLFFEYVDCLKHFKPKYFLLENVGMKKEHMDVITGMLGVEPILINSNLVSAQNRKRFYWTNIPNVTQPADKGILLESVLESWEYVPNGGVQRRGSIIGRRLDSNGKRNEKDKTLKRTQCLEIRADQTKMSCLTTVAKDAVISHLEVGNYHNAFVNFVKDKDWRYLTPVECERLQTVNDGYTDCVSDSQRRKMLGNGWTVDVIAHIFKNLNV